VRGVTHLTVGVASALLCNAVLPVEQSLFPSSALVVIAASAVGSLLPDVDHPGSMATRGITLLFKGSRVGVWLTATILIFAGLYLWFPLVGVGVFMAIMGLIPHRGVTHSLAGVIVAGFLVWVFGGNIAVPFCVGYMMHLFADMLTGGVPLLWPYNETIVFMRASVGGLLDYVFLFVSFGYIVYWAWIELGQHFA
jgi:inner membrane protein